LPGDVHPDFHESDDDAGVLADRAVPFGAHAAVGEDLRDRVLRRRPLLELIGPPERADIVHRVVVGDELERVGDRLDNIVLLDDRHVTPRKTACAPPSKAHAAGGKPSRILTRHDANRG